MFADWHRTSGPRFRALRVVFAVVALAGAGFATAALAQGSGAGSAATTLATAFTGPTVPHNSCVDVLQFGLVEVFGGTASNPTPTLCPNGQGGYAPSGGVEINGIVLPAGLVGTLVLNPSASTVSIDAQKIVDSIGKGPLAGPIVTGAQPQLTLTVQPDNGGSALQSQPFPALNPGTGSIGGLKISGNLTLSLTLSQSPGGTKIYSTALAITLKLPSIFSTSGGGGVTGTVVVSAANENPDGTANSAGLKLAGATIEIGTPTATTGGILLGPARVTYLCLSYTGVVTGVPSCQSAAGGSFVSLSQNCPGGTPAGDSWDGKLVIYVPPIATGLRIDGAAGTRAGKFSYAAAEVAGLNVPLYPAVTLTKIGFGVCIIANTAPSGGGLQLTGEIGLKMASVVNGDVVLAYKTTKNPVLSGIASPASAWNAVTNVRFDSLPTRWYLEAKGNLSITVPGAGVGPVLASADTFVDPHTIGITGQFGGSWTASGNVSSFLTGSAAVTIGAAVSGQVSLTNNAFNIFANVNASASGTFTVNTSFGSFGASASATGNGTLAVSDFGFGTCLNLSGSATGTVSVGHYVGWPVYAYVTFGSASASANFNFGLGVAQGFVTAHPTGPPPNTPAGYAQGFHAFWGACDIAPYEDVNLVGHYLVSPGSLTSAPRAILSHESLRVTAARAIPLRIAEGQRGELVSVIGKNGPPQITITAPNGEKLATPTEVKRRPAISPHMMVFVNTASHQTFIVLGKPPAGTYEITAKPGSTPIVGVRRAGVLPAPQVSATITAGSGRTRFLHYSIRPFPGQSVQFFEQGSVKEGGGGFDALGPVQGVTKSGVIRFSSADGPSGLRTILALVSQRGLPRTEFTVTTYVAPQSPR